MATIDLAPLTVRGLDDGQDGAETEHNLGLRQLMSYIGGVANRTLSAPPAFVDGRAHVIASSGSDVWTGKDGQIAIAVAGAWDYRPAVKGLLVWCDAEDTHILRTASEWVATDGEQTLVDAATIAVDASLGRGWVVTLGGNRTLGTPTNLIKGWTYVLRVIQDGTGTRLMSSWGIVLLAGGAVTLSTGGGEVDVFTLYYDGVNLVEQARALDVS